MLASVLAAAVVLVASAWAAAALPTVAVRVSPPTGLPSTTFTISFHTPDRTGRHGTLARHDELMAAVAPSTTAAASALASIRLRLPAGSRLRIIRPVLSRSGHLIVARERCRASQTKVRVIPACICLDEEVQVVRSRFTGGTHRWRIT